MGIAVDRTSSVYVADTYNNTIRKISPTGLVTTLAGSAAIEGAADGPARVALFRSPGGLAVDGERHIYVADGGNNTIRKGALSTARLTNIATRAFCGTDNKVTIGGFVVSGTGTKRILIRAVGPSLTAQGIAAADVLADPAIEVHAVAQNNTTIASNDNWADNPNAAEITATAATVGASALLGTDTKSSALLLLLTPGVYTFVVHGQAASSGIVLLEVYDADSGTPTATFSNIATRAHATTGNGVAIGGFVISGNAPKRVLLRAVGPTLTKQGLNTAEVLANPVIELHDAIHNNDKIGTNDNAGTNLNAADILATAARIGATPIDLSDTTSSALLVTLNPGVYSFIAQGQPPTPSGIVLVEIYDAD